MPIAGPSQTIRLHLKVIESSESKRVNSAAIIGRLNSQMSCYAPVVGAPDVATYSDSLNSWALSLASGLGTQSATVYYATQGYASGAKIYESYEYGFVTKIEAVDASDVLHTVWEGTDPTVAPVTAPTPGTTFSWTKTTYLVKGFKITINSNAGASYEEIDAVQFIGYTN